MSRGKRTHARARARNHDAVLQHVLLCREKALKGNALLMTMREPVFHGHLIGDAAVRALLHSLQQQGKFTPEVGR